MVLLEDKLKIFNEEMEEKLEDTNQQLKKWVLRWKPVIDHSMKRVQELAKGNSKPIWHHFTKNKPAKTKESRKLQKRKHAKKKIMLKNPLTNVSTRLRKNRSTSHPLPTKKKKYRRTNLISQMYQTIGKPRLMSRDKAITEVEKQIIDDRCNIK